MSQCSVRDEPVSGLRIRCFPARSFSTRTPALPSMRASTVAVSADRASGRTSSSRRAPFSILLLLILLPVLVRAAAAQDIHVRVQHGEGASGIVGYQRGSEVVRYDVPQLRITRLTLSPGDSICIDVENAHPVFYGYSITAAVDTSTEKLPAELVSVAALLQALLPGAPVAAARPTPAGAMARDDWMRSVVTEAPKSPLDSLVKDYYKLMGDLSSAIVRVQAEVKRSDVQGIRHAKEQVATLPATPSSDDLAKWFDAAKSKITAKDTVNAMVVAALKSHGESLIASRAALQQTYARNVPEIARNCAALGAGETTVTLKVGKKVDFAARDVGDHIATVVAEPAYQRAAIEAFPLFLVALANDVPRFGTENGVIVRTVDDDARLYRAGAAVVLNLPGSGTVAYGPALGLGVSTGGDLSLSDLFLGAVVSYKDYVRLGIGYGSTEVPSGLRAPAKIGAPLGESQVLDELIIRADRRAWYFTIALPKLTLKSPWS